MLKIVSSREAAKQKWTERLLFFFFKTMYELAARTGERQGKWKQLRAGVWRTGRVDGFMDLGMMILLLGLKPP